MSNESEKKEKKGQPSQLKSFLSGGVGGIGLVLVGHPFDLIKVRLQTAAKGEYTGALDVFKKALAKDGVRGLYRGMSTPLVGITPIFAVCFWGYDIGQRIAKSLGATDANGKLNMAGIMFAGGFSAIPTTAIMTPVERIKVILQTQGTTAEGGKKYKGPVDVAVTLYKQGGLASIYKGTAATLWRDIPGSVAYFFAYEVVKKALTPSGSTPDQLNPLAVLFAGGMAGVANWAVAIPADVLKSRQQSAPDGTYKNLMDVLVKTVRADGVPALFKGLGPAMLRAFPANAACFLGVEVANKVLNKLW